MQGSTFAEAETSMLVNGGSYTFEGPNGVVIEGIVMGVTRTPTSTTGRPDRVEGNMYIFSRGNIPIHVVESTESFQGWTLIAAPAKSAANHWNGVHKTVLAEREATKTAKAA